MKADIETIRRDDNIAEAARRMRDRRIGFLPVVDVEGKPTGAVTDRDIVVRGVAAEMSAFAIVGAVMSERVFCVNANDDLERAEQLMRDNRVGRTMCVDDNGRLVGVLSLADVAAVEAPQTTVETSEAVTRDRQHKPRGAPEPPEFLEDEGVFG